MSLTRAIATVGGFTLVSRVTGFVRDILIAAILGAGPVAAAFFVAFKLPNFFRRLTGEGALSVAFVPLFAGSLEDDGRKAALDFPPEVQAELLAVLPAFAIRPSDPLYHPPPPFHQTSFSFAFFHSLGRPN